MLQWFSVAEIYDRLEEPAVFLFRVLEGESCSSFKASVTFYQTTRRHIPEDSNLQMARNEPRLICVRTF